MRFGTILGITSMLLLTVVSCQNTPKENEEKTPSTDERAYRFEIKNLTDKDYPDNPDIGFMASDYDHNYLKSGKVSGEQNGRYTFCFYSNSENADSVVLRNLDLMEFMPSIPVYLKEDEYLAYVALINQEWNRNQVRFNGIQFQLSIPGIVRVDLARNCLNAYLWEVILFKQENGQELPFSHGWFDFPKPLYMDLFKTRNNVDFSQYQKALENWVDPENKEVDKTRLSKIIDTVEISFKEKSNTMYPVKGARKKKFKEIIHPEAFKTMADLQSDSTLFATFSPPGIYNKADPRKTELGRIRNLEKLVLYKVVGLLTNDTLYEIDFIFTDANKSRTTKLVLGGLDLSTLPALSQEDANDGWKNSMGFSNHPFYETYEEHLAWQSNKNPYYAYFTDDKNQWLDSHKIGVDGPNMYWDKANPNILHVWLLSFERHAFVAHYIIAVK